MSALLYADQVFSDCQIAIETLCLGCPDERGWVFMEGHEAGACCDHMILDVTDCQHPCVMEKDGRPYCFFRYRLYDLPEIEKYEKRMRGDWS